MERNNEGFWNPFKKVREDRCEEAGDSGSAVTYSS